MEKGENNHSLRNIWFLGGSSFINDVGSELITPILPFYITALGGSGAVVGLISGLREGLPSLVNIFGGWFSDRVGKRLPFVFFGYLLSAIMKFMMGFATSWQYLVASLSFERIGKLRDAPRDAIIAESIKKRGKGFGIQQMMDRAGAVVGTILVIFLFWKFGFSFKTIFFIAAGVSALSLIPLFFIRTKKIKPIKRGLIDGIERLSKKLKYIIFVTSIFALANFGLYLFILLKAEEVSNSIITAFILFAVYVFIYSLASIPAGEISDKIGRKKVLVLGYILFFVVCIGLANATTIYSVAMMFSLYGLAFAMVDPVQRAYISDYAGNMKATAMGTYYSAQGVIIIVAGILAGFIWDISQKAMFYYLGAIGLVALVLLLFAKDGLYIDMDKEE